MASEKKPDWDGDIPHWLGDDGWDPTGGAWCDVLGRGVRDVGLSLAQWCC